MQWCVHARTRHYLRGGSGRRRDGDGFVRQRAEHGFGRGILLQIDERGQLGLRQVRVDIDNLPHRVNQCSTLHASTRTHHNEHAQNLDPIRTTPAGTWRGIQASSRSTGQGPHQCVERPLRLVEDACEVDGLPNLERHHDQEPEISRHATRGAVGLSACENPSAVRRRALCTRAMCMAQRVAWW